MAEQADSPEVLEGENEAAIWHLLANAMALCTAQVQGISVGEYLTNMVNTLPEELWEPISRDDVTECLFYGGLGYGVALLEGVHTAFQTTTGGYDPGISKGSGTPPTEDEAEALLRAIFGDDISFLDEEPELG